MSAENGHEIHNAVLPAGPPLMPHAGGSPPESAGGIVPPFEVTNTMSEGDINRLADALLARSTPLPVAEAVAPGASVLTRTKERFSKITSGLRRNMGKVAIAGVLTAGAIVSQFTGSPAERSTVSSADAATGQDGQQFPEVDTCPDGVFPEGDFRSTEEATFNHLNVRPDPLLTDETSAIEFFFGNEIAPVCDSAATMATLTAVISDYVGEDGFGPRVGGSTDINRLAELFAERQGLAERSAVELNDIVSRGIIQNDRPISGTFYRAEKADADSNEVVWQGYNDVEFGVEEVFVVNGRRILSDGGVLNGQQVVVIDKKGDIWVAQAIGAPVREPDSQDDTDQNEGGGTFGTVNGDGESNQPGNVNEQGGNGGYTPGEAPSFGPGGGNGGGGNGGGGGNTPTTRPPTPTTQPPTPTTQPPTPTTQPPAPTTTTTTPPPTHPPSDGPPSGAGQ